MTELRPTTTKRRQQLQQHNWTHSQPTSTAAAIVRHTPFIAPPLSSRTPFLWSQRRLVCVAVSSSPSDFHSCAFICLTDSENKSRISSRPPPSSFVAHPLLVAAHARRAAHLSSLLLSRADRWLSQCTSVIDSKTTHNTNEQLKTQNNTTQRHRPWSRSPAPSEFESKIERGRREKVKKLGA